VSSPRVYCRGGIHPLGRIGIIYASTPSMGEECPQCACVSKDQYTMCCGARINILYVAEWHCERSRATPSLRHRSSSAHPRVRKRTPCVQQPRVPRDVETKCDVQPSERLRPTFCPQAVRWCRGTKHITQLITEVSTTSHMSFSSRWCQGLCMGTFMRVRYALYPGRYIYVCAFCASMQATEEGGKRGKIVKNMACLTMCVCVCVSVCVCVCVCVCVRESFSACTQMHVSVRARANSSYTHAPYMCIDATMYHGEAYRHTTLLQDIFAPGDGFPCQRAQLLVCLACAIPPPQTHIHKRTHVHTETARARERERERERRVNIKSMFWMCVCVRAFRVRKCVRVNSMCLLACSSCCSSCMP